MSIAIWITGLPGCGKSIITEEIKRRCPEFVILRMDEMRRIATPSPTYSEQERGLLYRSIVYTAQIVSRLGHDVIIDATGNLRKWRELARGTIPDFMEIYLSCPFEICRDREASRISRHAAPADIYMRASKENPVPGATAPYEPPIAPELTIDTAILSIDEAADAILTVISARKSL